MKKIFLLALILLVSGCAGTRNAALDDGMKDSLQGASVAVVTHESPSFVAMTSGKGMFAVLGVAAAVEEGNRLVEEKGIEDPAPGIGRSVAEDLSVRHRMKFTAGEQRRAGDNDIGAVVSAAAGADYAVDVETNGWSFIYDGFNFSEYVVGYSVKMRLVDVAGGRVAAEGFCAYDTKEAGKPNVSYETLLADDAGYIKQVLADAQGYCVEKFTGELF